MAKKSKARSASKSKTRASKAKTKTENSEQNMVLWFTAICILAIIMIFGAVIMSLSIGGMQENVAGEAFWGYAASGIHTSCSDTDSDEYVTKGRVTGFDMNKYVNEADECINNRILKEAICIQDKPDKMYYDCSAYNMRCAEGACI